MKDALSPPDKKTNKDVEKVLSFREASTTAWKQSKTNSELCQLYLCHEHYTDDQKKAAAKFKKPLLRYNMILPKLLAIQGREQVNRRVAKILARYVSDESVSQILNDNYGAICENENLEDKMNLAHMDALSYPIGGVIRRKIALDEMGYLNFKYEVLNPFFIHYDKNFRNNDMSDCQYVVVDDWLTSEQIIDRFGVNPDDYEYRTWLDAKNDIRNFDTQPEDLEYKVGDRYLVCELQERAIENAWVCSVNGSDIYELLTEKEIQKITKDKSVKIDIIMPSTTSRIVYTTVVPFMDKTVQKKPLPMPTTRFDLFPIFSFNLNLQKSKMPSLLYMLIDIQDRINKGMNQQVDFVTQNLGAPWHVAKTEREVIKDLETKGNLPGTVLKYVSINNKAIREQAPQIPPAIMQTVQVDQMFMNDISMITPAMEGRTERSGEPGVLYDAKLRESNTTTNPYFEIKADLRNRLANDYVELAPYVYFEMERPLQVKLPNGQLDYVMVNLESEGVTFNDIRQAKAKAILDEGDNTKTALEQNLEQNLAMVNLMINSGAQFIDIPWRMVYENSPIKDKDKWISHLEQRQVILRNQMDKKMATDDLTNLTNIAKTMIPQKTA